VAAVVVAAAGRGTVAVQPRAAATAGITVAEVEVAAPPPTGNFPARAATA